MHKHQQAIFWLIITPLFLLFASHLKAEPLYKVEIVVFKQHSSQNTPLDLAEEVPLTIPANTKELTIAAEDAPQIITYQRLSKDTLSLMDEEKALRRRRKYDVLLHVAWVQPISNKTNAIPVHLYGGQLYNELGQSSEGSQDIYFPHTESLFGGQAWELDGSIKISRHRLFNLKTDLMLSLPNSDASHDFEQTFNHYYLQQSQNLKADELHYFDHPLFGMLVIVTPYEIQETNNDNSVMI